MTARPRNLEPSQIPDGLVGALDRRTDGGFNAILRGAHDLDHAIDVPSDVALRVLQVLGLGGKIDRSVAPGDGACAARFRPSRFLVLRHFDLHVWRSRPAKLI